MNRPPFWIPREVRRDVALGFLALLGVLTAHSMLETARDTLFLSELPPSHLPLVYIAIAGLALGVARLNQKALARYSPRKLLLYTLAGAALCTALFWPFAGSSRTSLYALYIWTGLIATLAVTQLWILLSGQLDVSQAKRGFAVVAAGGLIGATLGAALSGVILQFAAPRHLVLVAALILGGTAALPVFFAQTGPRPEARYRRRKTTRVRGAGALGGRYLRRLLIMLALTTVTVTTADLLFKTVIAQRIPAESLGEFFAVFYTALNGLALVLQLFFAAALLRHLGVSRTLWVLPILLLASAAGFALTAAILPVMLLKIFDGSLRHSLNRTGVELLYMPLPAAVRNRHKVVVEAIGQRGGQALAALGVLIALALGAEVLELGAIVLVLASFWLAAVAGIKRYYVELFRERLRQGTIETRAEVPALDLHSLEALIAALSSSDERTVKSALDLLEESGRARLIPALILYHPSRDVVVRALQILSASGRTDFAPLARQLMQSIDPEMRTAALRAVTAVAPEESQFRQALGDPSPAVRATALVGMVCCGMSREEDRADLLEQASAGATVSKLALAHAVRRRPSPEFSEVLHRLAAAPEPEVRAEAAAAIAAAPDPSFLPDLLPLLADRRARPQARAAMQAIGVPALEFLDRSMEDPDLPRRIRLHLPRTISRFSDDRAASILLRHLERERDSSVGYKLLRGLGRLYADRRVRLDRARLHGLLEYMLERAIQLVAWQRGIERAALLEPANQTQGSELLLGVLAEKEESCVERAFRILGLLHPREDFAVLYDGLRAEDPGTRAYSEELLEYLVDPVMRDVLLGLMNGETSADKLEAAQDYHAPPAEPLVDQLRVMLADPNEAVACLTAHYIGELRLGELAPQLEAARRASRGIMAEVVGQVIALLSGPREVSSAS